MILRICPYQILKNKQCRSSNFLKTISKIISFYLQSSMLIVINDTINTMMIYPIVLDKTVFIPHK